MCNKKTVLVITSGGCFQEIRGLLKDQFNIEVLNEDEIRGGCDEKIILSREAMNLLSEEERIIISNHNEYVNWSNQDSHMLTERPPDDRF